MSVTDTFSARQAAYLSGLTPYMINYLCRTELLEPSGKSPRGRGIWRAYTFGDIVVLRALKRFLDLGISVKRLKQGLNDLRKHHPEITPETLPSRYLVSNGENIYFRGQEQVFQALDGSGQFVFGFIVELHQVRQEVLTALEKSGGAA